MVLIRAPRILAPLREKNASKLFEPTSSTSVVKKHLLSTLSEPHNPIAHSTIPQRAGV